MSFCSLAPTPPGPRRAIGQSKSAPESSSGSRSLQSRVMVCPACGWLHVPPVLYHAGTPTRAEVRRHAHRAAHRHVLRRCRPRQSSRKSRELIPASRRRAHRYHRTRVHPFASQIDRSLTSTRRRRQVILRREARRIGGCRSRSGHRMRCRSAIRPSCRTGTVPPQPQPGSPRRWCEPFLASIVRVAHGVVHTLLSTVTVSPTGTLVTVIETGLPSAVALLPA